MKPKRIACSLAALFAGSTLPFVPQPAGAATVTAVVAKFIDASKFVPPSPDTAGIVYVNGRFVLVDCEVDEQDFFANVNLWEMSPAGAVQATGRTTAYSLEPTGVGYEPRDGGTLYVTDDNARRIFVVTAGPDGKFGNADDPVRSVTTSSYKSTDPEGVTVDTGTGRIWIADGDTRGVVRIDRGGDGVLGGGDDTFTRFSLSAHGLEDAEGISYNSATQRIVVLDTRSETLYEIDRNGALVRTIDISAASPKGGGDVAAGPSSSGSGFSYWVAFRGVNNESDSDENDGRVYEMKVPGDAPPNQVPVVTITAPSNGASAVEGSPVTFTGTATDPESGNLSSILQWRSNLGGQLGSGATISVSGLTKGTHTITASATDPGGATGSRSITLTVTEDPNANKVPVVMITDPPSGFDVTAGTDVTFAGTAMDPEDGDLGDELAWTSNRDGPLATARSFTTDALSIGTHTVRASVQDGDGATASAAITVVVRGPDTGPLTTALVADATIQQSRPTTNFGAQRTLVADNSPVTNFLLKFRVTGLQGKTITSVRLSMVNEDKSSRGGDVRVFADTAWIESGSGGVTWGAAGAPQGAVLASFGKVAAGKTYELVLPASVLSSVGPDGLLSLRITSTSNDGADWWSREAGAARAPQLLVTGSG